MSDFEMQLAELERKRRDELAQGASKIEAKHAANGVYQSSATVKALLRLCEENHSALMDDISQEIRFFHNSLNASVSVMIEDSKKMLVAYRERFPKVCRLSKLQRILAMPSVDSHVSKTLDDLGNREMPLFRRLEIELPMLEDFMIEAFQLIDANGTTKLAKLKGRYADGKIITFNVQAPVITGDHLLRCLPNGFVEDFIVTDPTFTKGLEDIADSYAIKVRRSDEPAAMPSQVINNITAHISGANARMNVGSTDNSVIIIEQNNIQVFKEMRGAAQSGITEGTQRDEILRRIDELEAACGSSDFGIRYNEFIKAAAAHMTLFLPFIPALTQLLS